MRRRVILVLAILLILFFTFTSISTATREDIPPFLITPSTFIKPITEDLALYFRYEDCFSVNDLEY